eukprot:11251963-Alexandrium_andersonii.AAC.1
MTRSRSSGLPKSHDEPPGPGRKSNAPAGRTPRRGRLSAMAATLRGENTSATDARASPGAAPAANRARVRPSAPTGAEPASAHRPPCPSWESDSSRPIR